jgi:protein TonB
VRDGIFGIPLLSSIGVHIALILIASLTLRLSPVRRQDFLPINLIDVPRPQTPRAVERPAAAPEMKKPPSAAKPEKTKESKPFVRKESEPAPRPAPRPVAAPSKAEPAHVTDNKPSLPAQEAPPVFPSGSRIEGGGSEAGAGNLFGRGDVGVVPGAGVSGGGGGTASSGLGRDSGAPGLPAESSPIKTNREAKPIQTVRASYPPMALRAGLESDVTLRIEVDTGGNVTKAEIIKSGGAGFDEEALKAVKQSRFEPAQRDGHQVPAEFTYIYRFRLRR